MCGHIFNYVAGPFLCPHCREKMEAKFQEVKEYIRNNPGVSIQDVSENCDVPDPAVAERRETGTDRRIQYSAEL